MIYTYHIIYIYIYIDVYIEYFFVLYITARDKGVLHYYFLLSYCHCLKTIPGTLVNLCFMKESMNGLTLCSHSMASSKIETLQSQVQMPPGSGKQGT